LELKGGELVADACELDEIEGEDDLVSEVGRWRKTC